jgi:hypothetical protein
MNNANSDEISIEALRKELESGLDDFLDDPEGDTPETVSQEKPEVKVATLRPEMADPEPAKPEPAKPKPAQPEPAQQEMVLEMGQGTDLPSEKTDRAIQLLEKNIKWSEKMVNMLQKQAISQESKAKSLAEGQSKLVKKLDLTKFWILGTGLALTVMLWIMLLVFV